MCDVKNGQFSWSWRFKQLSSWLIPNESIPTTNIKMEAKSFGDSKWKLELHFSSNSSENKKYLVLKLHLIDYDENLMKGKLPLSFQYKLLTPEGEIFVASEVFNETFGKGSDSAPYQLIDIEDLLNHTLNWSEDSMTLVCYMAHSGLSLMLIKNQGPDCEIETIHYSQISLFEWRFKFRNCKDWSVSRRVYGLGVPLVITFRYVGDKIQIEISSNIEDDWEYEIGKRIHLFNGIGTKIVSEEGFNAFSKKNNTWMQPSSITKHHLKKAECFKDEEIRIKCDFFQTSSSLVSYSKNKRKLKKNRIELSNADCNLYLQHLQRDLHSLLVDKRFTDIQLRANNKIFIAHKALLAARSPVFSAMFLHDMVESNSGIVDIPDVESISLKSFLEFIYTGEIGELDEEKALTMLMMSDKYQVSSLKERCSKFLMSELTVNNACKILSVADTVHYEDLKASVREYIIEHSKEILSSSEWSEWTKNNIAMATEIILKLSNNFRK